MTQPAIPLETLHGQWCDQVMVTLGDELTPADDTAPGYEHTYAAGAGDDRRLVVVCPWHWPAYSHYQFWELVAIPWLARRAGYRDWCLVTNDAWTDWILPALRPLYGTVIVSDEPPVDAIRRWLAAEPVPVALPPDRPAGRILLGDPTPKQTTVTLKAAMAEALGDSARTGRTIPARLVEATLRPNFSLDDDQTLLFAKSFRNPDVVHEAKMLAGRSLLCPDGTRPVVVIDGRWRDAPELIASVGADVCTAGLLREFVS
ncbi:MAG: hypothetical protein AVDCRST_MAG33-1184 [uncultured Thermomicrobiales bacterium]|uniref:Uncharacterized protein n=1 Tax=uncultured Thermomicrobiales bacterium TaxID=1645740 RepID=A0A6J4US09_9BACT|nr:MAG: hypothetical protein AVDCRST_MAG33-1184 [uncultured Thermomicrobiales bacterium]